MEQEAREGLPKEVALEMKSELELAKSEEGRMIREGQWRVSRSWIRESLVSLKNQRQSEGKCGRMRVKRKRTAGSTWEDLELHFSCNGKQLKILRRGVMIQFRYLKYHIALCLDEMA